MACAHKHDPKHGKGSVARRGVLLYNMLIGSNA